MLPMDATHLIPQKFPFRMIDFLLSANEGNYRSNFKIQADNILLEDSDFSEGGLIENMAQTAAAGSGYEGQQDGMPVLVGYIGAVKNVQVFKRPQVGDLIETIMELKTKIGQASIMSGKIILNEQILASGELTIFVSPK